MPFLKILRRLGFISLIILGIIILFVVLFVVAYTIGVGICFVSFFQASTCDEPFSYLGISGDAGWFEWIIDFLPSWV